MTYLYTPTAGPLAGRAATIEAINDFHAEMLIADLTGERVRAGELVAVPLVRLNLPAVGELMNEFNRATAHAPEVG